MKKWSKLQWPLPLRAQAQHSPRPKAKGEEMPDGATLPRTAHFQHQSMHPLSDHTFVANSAWSWRVAVFALFPSSSPSWHFFEPRDLSTDGPQGSNQGVGLVKQANLNKLAHIYNGNTTSQPITISLDRLILEHPSTTPTHISINNLIYGNDETTLPIISSNITSDDYLLQCYDRQLLLSLRPHPRFIRAANISPPTLLLLLFLPH